VLLFRHRRETDDRLQLTANPATVDAHRDGRGP
jgi:hypothetical protein